MKREKRGLLFLAMGGTELSWLCAWATFLTTAILHHPFPFQEAIGTFALAAVLTLLSKGKGWRVVYVLGIQLCGFILAALRIAYVFNSWSNPFLSQAWLTEFFNAPRGPWEWFHLILVLFWALLFWLGGVTLARRSIGYSTLCSRFDLGIAAFFLLFLTRSLLLIKGGIRVEDPVSQLLLFPFFLFSLLSIGLVRNQSTTPRNFLSGYQSIGIIISFTLVVLLFGTALVLFFLPYLTLSAEVGHSILKTVARPLAAILVSVLRFIYFHGSIQQEKSSPPPKEGAGNLFSSGESSWWTELLEKILLWVFGSLIGLIALAAFGVAVFYLFRWLLSRTSSSRKRQSSWYLISLWVERLRIILLSWLRRIGRRVKGYRRGAPLYMALLSWGRRSGIPHFPNETPKEYGSRLNHHFPALKREIELIIDAFNREVYGEITLDEQQLGRAQFALRRLRSPLRWPLRIKTWFFRTTPFPEPTG
jgi:hypothetical protein